MENETKTKSLEKAVSEFESAIKNAKENPLVMYLDDYEHWIAGNIREGRIEEAKHHANLLLEYYLDQNPFRPEAEAKMEEIKDKIPQLYRMMDAGRKMYHIGQATKKILEFI